MTEPWRESYDDWKLRGTDDDEDEYDDEDRREMDADRKVDDERN